MRISVGRWRSVTVFGLMVPLVACTESRESAPAPSPASAPSAAPPSVSKATPAPDGDSALAPTDVEANLLRNPGFESGGDPWFSLKAPRFEISHGRSRSGRSSALLRMRSSPATTGSRVHYLVQEVKPPEFPEILSGHYMVERWAKGTPKQYVQFVVIVFGAEDLQGGYTNHQIRYPLAGIREDPFGIVNAFFVYVGNEEPRVGEWVYFERNIRQDFSDLWGAVPRLFSKIRVLFEVRFDHKEAGAPAEADVHWDDLYMGPAEDHPGRPHSSPGSTER